MTNKTILITGCSSGFGRETAAYFLDRDWDVIATMRSPDNNALPASTHLRILPLDVTDPASIEVAVAEAGPIDALVNNAGVGLMSIFEGTPMTVVRSILDTNLVGAMAVTQAFLPLIKKSRAARIVNVSSCSGRLAFPQIQTASCRNRASPSSATPRRRRHSTHSRSASQTSSARRTSRSTPHARATWLPT